MNKYKVYHMESINGKYTLKWEFMRAVQANTTREALRLAAPITTKLERPTLTRPRAGVSMFEYDNVMYCVEVDLDAKKKTQ